MTGKGVIIGIIDSGIDWRHEDFRRPDGKSRILAIWDLMDDSYQTTNGGVGSKPPVYLERDKKWLGTVYTNEQIDKAINGNGTLNSLDKFGHGTAVAGTAASNGRATANGIPAGTYAGVAPDAELIIVKAMDCNYFFPGAELTAEWIFDYARGLNKPVVVNMSFGSQFGPHDGTVESEQFIDSIVGPAKAGKIITVSAGNDGRYNVHANGTFAPK
jgi:subtilisin family serine protease